MTDKNKLLHLIGVDRLLYFTDALVAIAATLLVLPLVDAAGVYVVEHPGTPGHPDTYGSAADFLSSHADALLPFVISFLVIVRLWMGHHRLFSTVTAADPTLIWLDVVWAFTIVLLPLPTELTQLDTERSSVAFYIGTMLASSLLLMAIVIHVRKHPELRSEGGLPSLAPSVAISGLFAAARVLGLIWPNFLWLLVLVGAGFLGRVLGPRLDPEHEAPAAG